METMIGDYRLLERIGQGGFGTVWRATSPAGVDVALKMLHPEYAQDTELTARLLQEFAVLIRLDHPNLVSAHAVLSHNAAPVLVMDYVPGDNLSTELRRHEHGMPVDRALWMVAEVCAALDTAHEAGIVHRDVKPANILLERDGSGAPWRTAKLGDFGIARLGDGVRYTSTGMLVGTVGYIAPEIIRGEDPTPASDLYSIGLLLHETLTGSKLFPARPSIGVLEQHVTQAPELPDAWPSWMRDLVQACLDKDPARRPSAREVGTVLRQAGDRPTQRLSMAAQVRSGTEVTAVVPPAFSSSTNVQVRKIRRSTVAVVSLVAAAVALLASAGFLLMNAQHSGGASAASAVTTGTVQPPGTEPRLATAASETPSSGPSAPDTYGEQAPAPSPGNDKPGGDSTDRPPATTGGGQATSTSSNAHTPAVHANDGDLTVHDGRPDRYTVSIVNVAAPAGTTVATASSAPLAEIVVPHQNIGDLIVYITAPSGARHTVHMPNQNDRRTRLHVRVDLAAVFPAATPVAGAWRLHVADTVSGSTGYIDRWAITA